MIQTWDICSARKRLGLSQEQLAEALYVTIKVSLDNHDFSSMRVNLCTNPQYDSAQFGDTHYHIINHQKLYQNVYDLLCGIIPISK